MYNISKYLSVFSYQHLSIKSRITFKTNKRLLDINLNL